MRGGVQGLGRRAWQRRQQMRQMAAGAQRKTLSIRLGLVIKIFQDSLSYRIFERIHKALNIDENKN
jgi:hypothetical protein